MLQTYEKSKKS